MPESPDTEAIAAVRKRLSDWDEKQTQPPTHVEAECPVGGCDECFRGMLLWGTSDIRTLLAALATAVERADKAEAALKCDCGAMGDVRRDFQTRPHTEWCAANYHKATGPQAEKES